jgi:stearoyl-CoA desaturase (delta-9 desaturase)
MYPFLFFVAIWYLSLFTQTFFHHRYSAHGMYTMNKFWEKVFYVLTWLFQGSSYLSPYAYGIMHRYHHAYADTDKDPHSPLYSKNLWDMMWKTKIEYSAIAKHQKPVEERFSRNLPYWKFMENIADTWINRLFFVGLYVLFFLKFANHWYEWILLPFIILMAPVHGAIINWFAHKYGYVNEKVGDTSKNLLPLDFLMLGESYHNNHHKFGGRPNFGVKWHEIDPIYPFILLFNALGIIKLKRNNDLNYYPAS